MNEQGITVLEVAGVLYCDNCGTRIVNTEEWKTQHLKECYGKQEEN